MEFKIDKKEVVAVLVVFFLALGAMLFVPKSTLPGFTVAEQLRGSLEGKAAPFYIQAAAAAESAFSSFMGLAPNSPDAIVSFMLLFSPLLLALSSVFLYLTLRSLEMRRTVSAFGALLYAFSLVSLSFLPGVYGAGQIAALFFSLFLLFFCQFAAKGRAIMIVPALLFGALSAYTAASFGIAALAVVLSFAVSEYGKEGKRLPQFALLAIAVTAGAALSSENQLPFSLSGVSQVFSLLPFVLASAFCTAALFFAARENIRDFLLLLFGFFAAVVSPIAGGMVLAIAASAGVMRASGEKVSRLALLACAFFIVFFSIIGLALAAGANIYQAFLASLLMSAISPLMLHFYGYRSQPFFSILASALVALSLFLLLFYSSSQGEFYPAYSDADQSSALSYLSAASVSQIGVSGGQDAAAFFLPSAEKASQESVSSYLASGKPVPKSGAYLVLSLFDLDSGSFGEGYSSYSFAANVTSQRGPAALFVSQNGLLVLRDISPDGTLALSDATLLDSYGQAYATVPLSRMIFLQPSVSFDSPQNRLIVLEEGMGLPHFMKIYSGEAGELERTQEFGKVTVFRVK